MRGIAGEEHATVAEMLHPPAGERVDARPFDLEIGRLAQHRAEPRQDALGLLLLVGVGVPAELEVDAPDVVGLPVQQRRLVRMERRIEPEPALRREIGRHVNVGDQEAVAEHLPFPLQPEQLPHALREPSAAISQSQPSAIFAVGRGDRHVDAVRARGARRRRGFPSAGRWRSSAYARSTRYCSNQYCCRLTNAGRRWPGSGRRSKR